MGSRSDLSPNRPRPSSRAIAGMAVRLFAVLVLLAALLFLPAGRGNWLEAWLLIAAFCVFLTLYAAWGLWRDPEQLKERSRASGNVKSWDKAILGAYTAFLVITFVVAGVDAGRFRWSSVPLAVKAIAWAGIVGAGAVIFWSLAANTYLSRVARIQDDRGQVVVSTGPYGVVRHPMYLGIVVLFLCIPLALGSWWALIPGALIGVLFVVRTSKEDRMLRDELTGYEAYARSVRFRLLPGVW